jgi:thiol-disulfide isomerase/thioredoxin
MKRYLGLAGVLLCSYSFSADVPPGPAVGTVAPDFKVRNLVTGEEVALSSQRGKVVILTFWASWCAPCKRELPLLENAQQLVGNDRLVVFAINYQDTEAALAAIKGIASSWQISVMTDRSGSVAHLYSVSTIPHLFMIGRDGKIIANHLGYGDRTLYDVITDIGRALANSDRAR